MGERQEAMEVIDVGEGNNLIDSYIAALDVLKTVRGIAEKHLEEAAAFFDELKGQEVMMQGDFTARTCMGRWVNVGPLLGDGPGRGRIRPDSYVIANISLGPRFIPGQAVCVVHFPGEGQEISQIAVPIESITLFVSDQELAEAQSAFDLEHPQPVEEPVV